MDPRVLASIPPAQIPTVTATVFPAGEADNHLAPPTPAATAPVANDVPAAPTVVTPSALYTGQHASHPPYAEMIYTAISALKEENGSSKRAIAKYIEHVYKDHLPSNHSALLTHHLKRLKNNGLLFMVKNSYKLPRSDQHVSDSTAAPQPQRGRGRPPKSKPQPNLQSQVQPQSQSLPQAQVQAQQNAEVFAALGLGDEPAFEVKKIGPRPRKIAAAGVGQAGPAVRRGRPPGSGRSRAPKRAGRPPKPKSVSAISNGLKRRPGRPPKNQYNPTVIPFAAPAPGAAAATNVPAVAELTSTVTVPAGTVSATVPVASPRSRGRPRKNAAVAPALTPTATAPIVGAGRGRGRGRGRGPGRGRGRGRWVYPVMGQGQPLKISGRKPVGRPRKVMPFYFIWNELLVCG